MYIQFFSTLGLARVFNLACVFVLGLYLNPQLQAQDLRKETERCGADALLKEQLQRQNISMDEYLSQTDAKIQARRAAIGSREAQETVYTLPVVVHLVYYPTNTIESGTGYLSDCHVHAAMGELNKTFAQTHGFDIPLEFRSVAAGDTRIRFELATRDPAGNPTTGIIRHPVEGRLADAVSAYTTRAGSLVALNYAVGSWHTGKYINIYVYATSIVGRNFGGAATFPRDASHTDNGGSDFMMMNSIYFSPIPPHIASNNMSRVVAHEMGHYFRLEHIWGFGDGGFNGCDEDDGCADTPATQEPATSCQANPSCNPDVLRAMRENYMDYAHDACMKLFTSCQKTRMRDALTTFRYNLYAESNRALAEDPPPSDMAMYRDFQESRPNTIFFNADTTRFVVPNLLLTNHGQRPVNSLSIGLSVNGIELTRFDVEQNFGFCDVETVTAPSSINRPPCRSGTKIGPRKYLWSLVGGRRRESCRQRYYLCECKDSCCHRCAYLKGGRNTHSPCLAYSQCNRRHKHYCRQRRYGMDCDFYRRFLDRSHSFRYYERRSPNQTQRKYRPYTSFG